MNKEMSDVLKLSIDAMGSIKENIFKTRNANIVMNMLT
jgi:hypothetical protein